MSRFLSPLRTAGLAAAILALSTVVGAQAPKAPKPNWQNLDLQTDSVFGVSTERAYRELLGRTKATPVIVALIGEAVDVEHEDLQGSVWRNPKEVPGNNKDDDRDGYVDDVFGWNFTDSFEELVKVDTLEMPRLVRAMRAKYGAVTDAAALSAAERDSLRLYRRLNSELAQHLANPKLYGNADVVGADPEHGTHVAGIIAARRDNDIGINGVCDVARIMVIRAGPPTGDERDENVANAIRYAVDRGAKVLNMSFGKGHSPNKAVVDAAVKYAMSKDVLIVHAAGNTAEDRDRSSYFPTPGYADGSGKAEAWLEVGASGWRDDASLPAPFSSYGKTTVDVFAPGVRINAPVPGSKYREHSGTSMATPVVAGVAALIRSRYPRLTAVQVKDIIMKSVTKVTHNVTTPGRGPSVPFAELCVSGGVVNAYNAIKLAAEYEQSRGRARSVRR